MDTDFPILGSLVQAFPMSAPKLQYRLTVDAYLAMERASPERHLYLDGETFAMAGESDRHGIITVNIVVALGVQLKGTPCQARTKDTKVRSGPVPESGRGTKGMFSYPDVLVICGEPEHHDAHRDVVLNPKAIVDVLSEATEAFDRGDKFQRYQKWNSTLTDYILVRQDQPSIEHFERQADGSWSYNLFTGLEASVPIPSIKCVLKLVDVYDRIVFDEESKSE